LQRGHGDHNTIRDTSNAFVVSNDAQGLEGNEEMRKADNGRSREGVRIVVVAAVVESRLQDRKEASMIPRSATQQLGGERDKGPRKESRKRRSPAAP
jgi:hypothetical protein